MNKFLKYGPIRFIISQLILCIPLIWKGELQLLLVSEKFYYWLTGTLILSLCIFFKIKIVVNLTIFIIKGIWIY